MKIRDRIKELRRVKASELHDMLPCDACSDASNNVPRKPKVFSESLVPHPICVLFTNFANKSFINNRLRVLFSAICTSLTDCMLQVLRARNVFKIFQSVVSLIRVFVVDFVISRRQSKKRFSDKPMHKSRHSVFVMLDANDFVTCWQGTNCTYPSFISSARANGTADSPKVARLIIAV